MTGMYDELSEDIKDLNAVFRQDIYDSLTVQLDRLRQLYPDDKIQNLRLIYSLAAICMQTAIDMQTYNLPADKLEERKKFLQTTFDKLWAAREGGLNQLYNIIERNAKDEQSSSGS